MSEKEKMSTGVSYTKEQLQVIRLRDRNLLVSAAAGSGKTAVLVERIIQKVTDQNRPVDIDNLLIVTFTNAAAAEMRERIGAAIEKKLEEHPEDVHLQRQQTLLNHAQITTIHSFCMHVIRDYFHRIDLEPDFRMGDEGELKLLKQDVLKSVLEQRYQEKEEGFLRLAETLAPGKSDIQLRDVILSLYEFSMSYPWPDEWLLGCLGPYEAENLEDFETLPLHEAFCSYCFALTNQWAGLMESCVALCGEPDGPQMYEPLLAQELAMLSEAASARGFLSYYDKITAITFGRLPAARKFTGDPGKKQLVQDTRNAIKDSRKKLLEQFFFQAPEKMVGDLAKNREIVSSLLSVTTDFSLAFGEKKREKNMLDFNDLEHFALKILVDGETKEPTQTAKELQKGFEEIMIDEYQDSNFVQETLLKAVSGRGAEKKNLFMVGDVKQSIYRFRMARPELFMEKYDRYTAGESEEQRIDLHMNFRSRPQVLEAVNDIFYRIMGKDLGNVEYDDDAALYPGAKFETPGTEELSASQDQEKPESVSDGMFDTEVLVLDSGEFSDTGGEAFEESFKEGDDEEYAAKTMAEWDVREAEAAAIGVKIKQLLRTQLVTDKESGKLRPMQYKDVVILMRGIGSFGDKMIRVLGDYGIPAQAATGTGYFSAVEVQTVLNLLRLIDNPLQDIPMAAVLKSPIVGLSGEDLAKIRIEGRDCPFYRAVAAYGKAGEDLHLREKIGKFLTQLEGFRDLVSDTAIHELVGRVTEETGYLDYVYALPAGEVRRANLEMLLEKAIAYEATSYRGLFHFIRYIDQLQTYQVDFSEAGEEAVGDFVRIMTIHKSKGLEFPVVFVAGMGRLFNQQDVRNRLVLHPGLGIGLDVLDLERRTRTPSLARQILARQIQIENAGEELRVLYVALTRAKEKLILTGAMKNAPEKLEAMERQLMEKNGEKERMSFLSRLTARSYFDWVLPALKCCGEKYEIRIIGMDYLLLEQLKGQLETELTREQLAAELSVKDEDLLTEIEKRLSFRYPYEHEIRLKTKLSVSELKHRAMDQLRLEEEDTEYVFQEQTVMPYVPAFMQGRQEENMGALRGTAMHRVLECFDFTAGAESLPEQIKEMRADGRLGEEFHALLSLPALSAFLKSPLAVRMERAAMAGKLYREKPFVMGKPAGLVMQEKELLNSRAMVLIQGIIDAFFEEEGELVLVDYKTDRVDSAEELTALYRTQMELYQEAMEKATGKQVKEKLLYSFRLTEVCPV